MLLIGLVILQKGVGVVSTVTALNYLLDDEGYLVITSNYHHKSNRAAKGSLGVLWGPLNSLAR